MILHCGQLWEVLGVDAGEVELTHAAAQVNVPLFLLEHHHVVGHFSNNLSKKPGREDGGAGLLDFRFHGGADARLLVVAGDGEAAVAVGL